MQGGLAACDGHVGARPGGGSIACRSLFVGVGGGCSSAAAGGSGGAPDVSGQDGAVAQADCSEGASAPRPSEGGGGGEEAQLGAAAPTGAESARDGGAGAALDAPKWKGVNGLRKRRNEPQKPSQT